MLTHVKRDSGVGNSPTNSPSQAGGKVYFKCYIGACSRWNGWTPEYLARGVLTIALEMGINVARSKSTNEEVV